ncbi:MAG: PP2C family protein-serine/threonine phosphatase [Proteobacteria bacterium]|nr:PP2C family protein-serine/threonine phosphatase [Pseudomonadota bacterium]
MAQSKALPGIAAKPSFKSKISLALYLNGMNLFMLILATIAISWKALVLLKDNKYRDIVVILYNDTHNLARALTNDFPRLEKIIINGDITPKILQHDPKKKIWLNKRGFNQKSFTELELGLSKDHLDARYTFTELAGAIYLVVAPSRLKQHYEVDPETDILLFQVNIDLLANSLNRSKTDTLNYIISRSGKVIFSNRPELNLKSVRRPLVEVFIETPVASTQMDFEDPKTGQGSFGSFVQIADSNLTLFSETPRQIITKEVQKVMRSFVAYAAITFVLALFGLIFVNHSLTGALADLLGMVEKVGSGLFDVKPKSYSFGEVNKLQTSFVAMSQSLNDRDKRIADLIVTERQGAVFRSELHLAQEIQSSFLPKSSINLKQGLNSSSLYIPSGFVAGDWFGEYYDEQQERLFVMIADVSGHGAGSAMYTAMIAALFEQAKIGHGQSIDIITLYRNINATFLNIGKTKWHVTSCSAMFDFKAMTLSLFNAGHPLPLLLMPEESGLEIVNLGMGSDPLGLMAEPKIVEKSFPLRKGLTMLLYTDGLLEGKDPSGKLFGKRNLIKLFKKHAEAPPEKQIEQIKGHFLSYINAPRGEDDICAIALKFIG